MTGTLRPWWERRRALERLRDIELFSTASSGELRAVDALLTEVSVPAGRVLMTEGGPGADFVIVADGVAEATRNGEILGEVGAGSFFGEISLLNHEPRTATVTALTPMRLYVLSRFEFACLLELSPAVRAQIVEAAFTRSAALRADAA